jgi:hypothetical protein
MTAGLFDDPRVAELLGSDLTNVVGTVFHDMSIAEEEIARARGTETTDRDDPVWNAFRLLLATHPVMRTEFVYRAHVRELLARVAAGEDTRPGTDAEILGGISEASQAMPLSRALVCLQARLFKRALPDKYELIADDLDLDTYERTDGREADDWERKLRHKARQDWRT